VKIYLAGAIWGVEDPVTWRRKLADRLPQGWEAIDPTQIELFVENEHEEEKAREIVSADLNAIQTSNAFLARIDRPSWGTAMEMFYAYNLRIPVIGWIPNREAVSEWGGKRITPPWVRAHSDIVTSDFEVVTQFLQNLLVKA